MPRQARQYEHLREPWREEGRAMMEQEPPQVRDHCGDWGEVFLLETQGLDSQGRRRFPRPKRMPTQHHEGHWMMRRASADGTGE